MIRRRPAAGALGAVGCDRRRRVHRASAPRPTPRHRTSPSSCAARPSPPTPRKIARCQGARTRARTTPTGLTSVRPVRARHGQGGRRSAGRRRRLEARGDADLVICGVAGPRAGRQTVDWRCCSLAVTRRAPDRRGRASRASTATDPNAANNTASGRRGDRANGAGPDRLAADVSTLDGRPDPAAPVPAGRARAVYAVLGNQGDRGHQRPQGDRRAARARRPSPRTRPAARTRGRRPSPPATTRTAAGPAGGRDGDEVASAVPSTPVRSRGRRRRRRADRWHRRRSSRCVAEDRPPRGRRLRPSAGQHRCRVPAAGHRLPRQHRRLRRVVGAAVRRWRRRRRRLPVTGAQAGLLGGVGVACWSRARCCCCWPAGAGWSW